MVLAVVCAVSATLLLNYYIFRRYMCNLMETNEVLVEYFKELDQIIENQNCRISQINHELYKLDDIIELTKQSQVEYKKLLNDVKSTSCETSMMTKIKKDKQKKEST